MNSMRAFVLQKLRHMTLVTRLSLKMSMVLCFGVSHIENVSEVDIVWSSLVPYSDCMEVILHPNRNTLYICKT